MAKGYWIAHVEVRDPEGYKGYVAAAKIAFDKYGAKMLARGGAYEQTEGRDRSRNVVIEFPSLKAAQDCYHSPEYQAAQGDPAEICRSRDGAGRRRRRLTRTPLPPAIAFAEVSPACHPHEAHVPAPPLRPDVVRNQAAVARSGGLFRTAIRLDREPAMPRMNGFSTGSPK